MSSYDGSRSARQSKRYSMSALYLSIANEADLEIEDDLAKGLLLPCAPFLRRQPMGRHEFCRPLAHFGLCLNS